PADRRRPTAVPDRAALLVAERARSHGPDRGASPSRSLGRGGRRTLRPLQSTARLGLRATRGELARGAPAPPQTNAKLRPPRPASAHDRHGRPPECPSLKVRAAPFPN